MASAAFSAPFVPPRDPQKSWISLASGKIGRKRRKERMGEWRNEAEEEGMASDEFSLNQEMAYKEVSKMHLRTIQDIPRSVCEFNA